MVAPPAHLCRKRYFTNGSFGVRSSHCSTDCSGLTAATKLQHVARQSFFRSTKKAHRSAPFLFRQQRSVVAARALALVFLQALLADADRYRRQLDELVIVDELQRCAEERRVGRQRASK